MVLYLSNICKHYASRSWLIALWCYRRDYTTTVRIEPFLSTVLHEQHRKVWNDVIRGLVSFPHSSLLEAVCIIRWLKYRAFRDPLNWMKHDNSGCIYASIVRKKMIGWKPMHEDDMSTKVNAETSSWRSRCSPPNVLAVALSLILCWSRFVLFAILKCKHLLIFHLSYLEAVIHRTRTSPSRLSASLIALPQTNTESPGFNFKNLANVSKCPLLLAMCIHTLLS